MTNDKADFTQGSILKKLVAFMFPVLGALILQAAYGAVDLLVVGRFGSTSGLSAVSTGSQVLNLVTFVVIQLAMGITVLIARYLGEKRREQIGSVIGGSAIVFTIISVILFVIMVGFARPISVLMQAPAEAVDLTASYVRICGGGILFIVAYNLLAAIFRGLGDSKSPLLFVLVACIVNIFGDLFLVAGLHMDAAGAAIATVISQAAAAVWTVRFLTGKKALIRIQRRSMQLQGARVKKIMGLGLAGFTMSVTNSTVQMVCNATLQTHGGDVYVGIMTIINSVREIISLPVQGFTSASQPVLGYNYGAKEYERVKKTIRTMAGVTIVYTLAVWGLVSAIPGAFIRMFGGSGDTLTLGISAMHLYFFGFFFMAFQFCGQSTFTALGKAKHAMFFSIFRKIIIVVPLTLILPYLFGLGVHGVFIAEPISNAIGGLACFITMIVTVYRKLGRE